MPHKLLHQQGRGKNRPVQEWLKQPTLPERIRTQRENNQETDVQVRADANKSTKPEIIIDPTTEQTDRTLVLANAYQDELQQQQFTETKELESVAGAASVVEQLVVEKPIIIDKVRSLVEKTSQDSKFAAPSLRAQPETKRQPDIGHVSALEASPPDTTTQGSRSPLEEQPLEKPAIKPAVKIEEDDQLVTEPFSEVYVPIDAVDVDDFPELTLATSTDEPVVNTANGLSLQSVYEESLLTEEDITFSTNLVDAYIWHGQEVVFDDEIMETYEDLLQLLSAEEEIPMTATETYEDFAHDTVILLKPETSEPIEANAFEDYIATQVQPDVIPDLETILSSVNEQSLEETFAQLSFYLAEVSQDSEQIYIETALRDVVEAFSQNTAGSVAQETKVAITPELTQKLLMLLKAVGYENPREVLVEFITQYSLEFLFQAIRYLYQLTDNNQPEFSSKMPTALTFVRSDEPLSARIGRAIMFYARMHKAVPGL